MWTVYIKEKNVYYSSLIPSQCNAFLYFLEGQVHKHTKLGIMTNVGKNMLVKVIFANVHKISNAYANSFRRYIMIAQCVRNVFTYYYINSSFSEKMVFLRKQKLIYPCILYERLQRRDDKVITILYDRFLFTEL